MKNALGGFLQVLGLFVLAPLALYEGMREGGSLGNELLIGFVAFLVVMIGRGLRGGGGSK